MINPYTALASKSIFAVLDLGLKGAGVGYENFKIPFVIPNLYNDICLHIKLKFPNPCQNFSKMFFVGFKRLILFQNESLNFEQSYNF